MHFGGRYKKKQKKIRIVLRRHGGDWTSEALAHGVPQGGKPVVMGLKRARRSDIPARACSRPHACSHRRPRAPTVHSPHKAGLALHNVRGLDRVPHAQREWA